MESVLVQKAEVKLITEIFEVDKELESPWMIKLCIMLCQIQFVALTKLCYRIVGLESFEESWRKLWVRRYPFKLSTFHMWSSSWYMC